MPIPDEHIKLILDLVKGGQTDDAVKTLEKFRTSAKETSKGVEEVTNKSKGLGQTVLQTSYAFQDFTSQLGTRGFAGALMAVQNNIPNIVAGIGGGAGMAGAISAVSVGAGLLIPQLEKIGETLGFGATKTEAEAMEELGKQTKLTAAETEKLNKYKKEQAELTKILESQSKAQQEEQAGFEEFFAGQGGKIHGAIAGALGVSGRGEQMNEAEIQATGEGAIDSAVTLAQMTASRAGRTLSAAEIQMVQGRARAAQQAARGAAQQRINEANVTAAGKLLGKAPTDRGARATIAALAKQVPGAFPAQFGSDFASMEPEAGKAQDAIDKVFQDQLDERAGAVTRRNANLDRKRISDKENEDAARETDRLQAEVAKHEESRKRIADQRAFRETAHANRAIGGGELAQRRAGIRGAGKQAAQEKRAQAEAERRAAHAEQVENEQAQLADMQLHAAHNQGMITEQQFKFQQAQQALSAITRQQNHLQRLQRQGGNTQVGQQGN